MYHPNFYNNFDRNSYTFQNNFQPLVPPPPPPFFIPPLRSIEEMDQSCIKHFENKIPARILPKPSVKTITISDVHEQLRRIIVSVNELKTKAKYLSDKACSLEDGEWNTHMNEIDERKEMINRTLANLNSPLLDVLRKRLAKRAAKRLRLKTVRTELKREKEEKRKELEERSRKIDENLQKIKDEITNAQKEQEAKLEADMVLREVLRKKHDAKKCIVKLDALAKLRQARHNTAKGRGESVAESETRTFYSTIEKLKYLWTQKLAIYEQEETDLRLKLKENAIQADDNATLTEKEVTNNLKMWRDVLFGGQLPQVDFGGNVHKFINTRSQWDQMISDEGTPLPIGWVAPKL